MWSRRAAELEGSLEEGEMVRQDLEKMVETLKVKLERSEDHAFFCYSFLGRAGGKQEIHGFGRNSWQIC